MPRGEKPRRNGLAADSRFLSKSGNGTEAPSQSRFYWLSDEDVGAAVRLLALLARGEGFDVPAGQPLVAPTLEERARHALALRQRRIALLGDMFSTEAPFAMLLALYAGRTRAAPHTVTELNEATRLPPSTALRWLGPLVSGGWVTRTRGSDARRSELRLTKKAGKALDELFGALP